VKKTWTGLASPLTRNITGSPGCACAGRWKTSRKTAGAPIAGEPATKAARTSRQGRADGSRGAADALRTSSAGRSDLSRWPESGEVYGDSCRPGNGTRAGRLADGRPAFYPPRVRSSGWRLPPREPGPWRDARDAPRRSPETGPRRAPVDRLLEGRHVVRAARRFLLPVRWCRVGGVRVALVVSSSSEHYRADTYATKEPRRSSGSGRVSRTTMSSSTSGRTSGSTPSTPRSSGPGAASTPSSRNPTASRA